jgi:hypothetical protein
VNRTILTQILVILFLTVFLFGCKSIETEFKQIQIPRSKEARYNMAQVEPSIAINPNNTNELIAGTVMDDFYHSLDGGVTWKSETMSSEFGVYGDPVVHIDKLGNHYYFHLSRTENTRMDRIVCQFKSQDSDSWSTSFTQPTKVQAQDKHWVAECPKTNNLYLTWTQFDKYGSEEPQDSSVIMFSKSIDQGVSWSVPIRISKLAGDCKDGDQTVEGAVPAVGADGTLYVVWTGPHGIRLNTSKDEGNTWLNEELFVSDQIGGWTYTVPGIMRSNGLPIIKVDNSGGQFDGRIYINWSDQRNGPNDTDIFLIHSDDEGETWSDIKRVNQDGPNNHQFFTWMDIDQSDGNLYFVFHDRRNGKENETGVYAAFTKDGGESFVDFPISKHLFVPDEKLFFGDYNNIVAHNGVIRPIWPEMINGQIKLYTSLIDKVRVEKIIKINQVDY